MRARERAAVERRRFTAAEYNQMGEAGILSEDDRVELIDGEIIEMSPIGDPHVMFVNRLTMLLAGSASVPGEGYIVSVQNPVRLSNRDEPQPDLVLLRGGSEGGSRPIPENVLLVAEVANTSLVYYREVKLPLYARAGIPDVWLVNLRDGTVEVHSGATVEGHRTHEVLHRGASVSSKTIAELSLRTGDILG